MSRITINLIIVALSTSSAFGQIVKEDSIPAVVKQACKQKFPSAKKIEWKKKSDKNYEAEFKQNGAELAIKFSPDGKWIETESAIKEANVPSDVKDAVAKNFPGYKTIERQSIETPGSSVLVYEIHVKKSNEVIKLQYSAEGKQLNKSSKALKPSKSKT